MHAKEKESERQGRGGGLRPYIERNIASSRVFRTLAMEITQNNGKPTKRRVKVILVLIIHLYEELRGIVSHAYARTSANTI